MPHEVPAIHVKKQRPTSDGCLLQEKNTQKKHNTHRQTNRQTNKHKHKHKHNKTQQNKTKQQTTPRMRSWACFCGPVTVVEQIEKAPTCVRHAFDFEFDRRRSRDRPRMMRFFSFLPKDGTPRSWDGVGEWSDAGRGELSELRSILADRPGVLKRHGRSRAAQNTTGPPPVVPAKNSVMMR